MEGLVYLSGEEPELAEAELRWGLISSGSNVEIISNMNPIMILDGPPPHGFSRRMGFCHFSGRIYQRTDPDPDSIMAGVRNILAGVSVNIPVSFRVKSTARRGDLSASILFERMEDMMVGGPWKLRHRNYQMKIFIVADEKDSYLGMIDSETDRKEMLRRRGSRLPYSRPVSMDPRLSRAMVNLSGLRKGSVILDPFTGPGGLLVEAAKLGHICYGFEIDERILKGARLNINELGVKDSITTFKGDSRNLSPLVGRGVENLDGIITDPPFGRGASTGGLDPKNLLREVLTGASEYLRSRSPVVLDYDDPLFAENLEDYNVKEVYPIRVHRSMTRYITRLEKN
jgi:putative methyltransferase (TIGR01177 family)